MSNFPRSLAASSYQGVDALYFTRRLIRVQHAIGRARTLHPNVMKLAQDALFLSPRRYPLGTASLEIHFCGKHSLGVPEQAYLLLFDVVTEIGV